MPSYPNHEFAELWEKVKERYFDETNQPLQTKPEIVAFVMHIRKFSEVSKELLESKKGDQEGLAIYLAVRDIEKNTHINLGSRYYKALKAYGDNSKRTHLSNYHEYLRSFYTNPGVLGDLNLNLEDLFISPSIPKDSVGDFKGYILTEVIIKWLKGEESVSKLHDHILILLGDPGQGKTSLCYHLLYKVVGNINMPVYFCKLRYILDIEKFYKDPYEVIFNYLQNLRYNLHNKKETVPINQKTFSESLLILDGLDELEKIHNINKDTFCIKLAQLGDNNSCPNKIILTSRKDINRDIVVCNNIACWTLNELTINDQKQWLSKYNNKTNNSYDLTLEELEILNNDRYSTSPLMKQPILLHIIAQANIRPNTRYNSSKIYDELFTSLIRRYWNTHHNIEDQHPVLSKSIFSEKQLRSILRDIGLEMFRKATTHLSHSELPISIINQLGLAENNSIEALKTLLIAFYFNYRVIDNNDLRQYAAEFLHKTFGEYFAAEAIWHNIKNLFNERGKPVEFILQNLNNIFDGAEFLSDQINLYLVEIILNERESLITTTEAQLELAGIMHSYLKNLVNFEFSYINNKSSNLISSAFKVLYGYISVYRRICTIIYDENNNKDLYNNFYRLIISLSYKIRLNLSFSDMNNFNLSRINLVSANLHNVDFRKTNLSFSNLNEAIMDKSNLTESTLIHSTCHKTDISYSDLRLANLSYSQCHQTNFYKSNLQYTNLSYSSMIASNLSYATLESADLTNADLTNANLAYTNFSYAKGIIFENISKAKTLYGCLGLEKTLLDKLQLECPNLFNAKRSD